MKPPTFYPANWLALIWAQRIVVALLLLITLHGESASAAAPLHTKDHFNDLAGKVDEADDNRIEANLAAASTSSGIQLMLVVINRFEDYPGLPTNARDFAMKLAQEWNVGSREKKGIVVLFALGNRQFHVVKTTNLPVSLTESIASSMKGYVTAALSGGRIGEAMSQAADNMVVAVARFTPTANLPAPNTSGGSPSGIKTAPAPATPIPGGAPKFDPNTRSTGGSFFGLLILVIGGVLLILFVLGIIGALTGRSYGPGRSYAGGAGPAPFFGGFGGGGGGGGFFSGMLLGGLMGNLFGGGWHSGRHSSDDNNTSSWGGSSGGSGWDSGGGSSGGSSDSGGGSSFGGGDFGGGSSGGSW